MMRRLSFSARAVSMLALTAVLASCGTVRDLRESPSGKPAAVTPAVSAAVLSGAPPAPSSDPVSSSDPGPYLAGLDALYPELEALYMDLHRNPEVSLQEEKTAAKLAERLRALGFEVSTGIGGHGIVGLLRNGEGPVVMLRTDLDALPVEEKTGLPYASQAQIRDASGAAVKVMHACGHDVHMTAWIGAATLLSKARDRWRGTLLMVGQPAEERGVGAASMLKAGLFERFPKPAFALAIHTSADLPSGKVGFTSGFALANVDSADITVFGKGGHGAFPHTTIDPVVIAARTVVALQTIVSREKSPFDPTVVTVGSIHGGTKHNIVPDEVRLQLTLRSYGDDGRQRLRAAVERIARAEAQASLAPREPEVKFTEGIWATYNDPELTRRLAAAAGRVAGAANVVETQPVMGGEDFSEFVRAGVPGVIFWIGAVEPQAFEKAKASGATLPSLHSSSFAPDRERTLRTAVTTLTAAAVELLPPR